LLFPFLLYTVAAMQKTKPSCLPLILFFDSFSFFSSLRTVWFGLLAALLLILSAFPFEAPAAERKKTSSAQQLGDTPVVRTDSVPGITAKDNSTNETHSKEKGKRLAKAGRKGNSAEKSVTTVKTKHNTITRNNTKTKSNAEAEPVTGIRDRDGTKGKGKSFTESKGKKIPKRKNGQQRPAVYSMLPPGERAALRERGIYSGFGPRAASRKGKGVRMHKGIDVAAPTGSSVLVFNDGEVIFSGRNKSYGINVVILQTDGRIARYAHMQTSLVARGDRVVRGNKIGLVGRTGRSTGPHLHFEIIEDGRHVDPALHVWDSTELVLRPNDLDPNESFGYGQVAVVPDFSAAKIQ
jgi:murein DD-endopeptidase MepM/ murein hydrolase activator NlpD